MWINNNLIEKIIKDDQEIPDGFRKGRLKRITKFDKMKLVFPKQEIFDYYIVQNHDFVSSMEHFNLTRSDFRILLNGYKISKDSKQASKNNKYNRTHEQSVEIGKKSSETQKKNYKQKSNEEKEEFSKLRKEQHSTQKFKETISKINKEYRKNLPADVEEQMNKKRSQTLKEFWSDENNKKRTLQKMKDTYNNNKVGRKCRTLSEQKMYDFLVKKFPDLMYDVRVDDRYPFYCDFYIPSKDLFIELNAHPSHGRLPFDRLKFEEYQYYKPNWFDVLSRRDVEKYEMAKSNNLNYIRIYPQATLQENIELNPIQFKDIVILSYNSQ